MARLLLMEGNTADRRAKAASLGVRTSSEIYALAIKAHFPKLELDVVNAADEDWSFPQGRSFADYQGMVITGSSLHSYDQTFAVKNQIEVLIAASREGLPVFGSCWGLQIAAVAGGGRVERSPKGREIGFARKILLSDAGKAHPMFRGKAQVYDAPCIHYDEVTRLPEGSTLLSSNAHSVVQAAIIPLGKSEVWAVQYHPEYDLAQLVQVYRLYEEDMISQGFFASKASLEAYVKNLSSLADNPDDKGLSWQFGIDSDITDDRQRRAEIINWVNAHIS